MTMPTQRRRFDDVRAHHRSFGTLVSHTGRVTSQNLASSAAAFVPLAARAQQGERVRRVGVLMGQATADPAAVLRAQAFEATGRELGWIAGRNIRLDYRWAPRDLNVLRSHAAELVASAPDVIVVDGTPLLAAVRQQTSSLPIVFAGISDPEGSGVVANIARPGGASPGSPTSSRPSAGNGWRHSRTLRPP
jgi:putative ABC transport system substrate-binding protein